MGSILNPYLSFTDNAREAMEFYQSVFGGDLDVMTFGQMGGQPEDGVMHSQLVTPAGYTLMGSDNPPEMGPAAGNGAVSLSGDEVEALQGYFAALSEGGQVDVPLEKQMWGDHFGMCTDKYGVRWLVNISGDAV
jgi:PhnB protein